MGLRQYRTETAPRLHDMMEELTDLARNTNELVVEVKDPLVQTVEKTGTSAEKSWAFWDYASYAFYVLGLILLLVLWRLRKRWTTRSSS